MSPLTSHGGHSAKVKMQLLVNGICLDIAQMGRDFLLIDKPIDHTPDDATILLEVDGSKRTWNVFLPDGMNSTLNRVRIGNSG